MNAAALPRNGCLKLLLAANADPTMKMHRYGGTALRFAATKPDATVENIQSLVAAGADPNVRDSWGRTPLAMASQQDNHLAVACLLDMGSEINALKHNGDSPLRATLFFPSDTALQILLNRGASYDRLDSVGDTILHNAATSGTLRTLLVLRAPKLIGVDPDASNPRGETAMQIAHNRTNKPPGFAEALEELLRDIRARNTAHEEGRPSGFTRTPGEVLKLCLFLLTSLISGSFWMEPVFWIWLSRTFDSMYSWLQEGRLRTLRNLQYPSLRESKWFFIGLAWAIGILCGLLFGSGPISKV